MIQNNKNNWLYGLQVVALNRLSFTFCSKGEWQIWTAARLCFGEFSSERPSM